MFWTLSLCFMFVIEIMNDDCYIFRSSESKMKNMYWLYCSYVDDCIAIFL